MADVSIGWNFNSDPAGGVKRSPEMKRNYFLFIFSMMLLVASVPVWAGTAGNNACCGGQDMQMTAAPAATPAPAPAKAEQASQPQTYCPVMTHNKVTKQSPYVDVKGKRIYVCCQVCAAKVKADPDKYIKQMEKQGVTLETTPAKKK